MVCRRFSAYFRKCVRPQANETLCRQRSNWYTNSDQQISLSKNNIMKFDFPHNLFAQRRVVPKMNSVAFWEEDKLSISLMCATSSMGFASLALYFRNLLNDAAINVHEVAWILESIFRCDIQDIYFPVCCAWNLVRYASPPRITSRCYIK